MLGGRSGEADLSDFLILGTIGHVNLSIVLLHAASQFGRVDKLDQSRQCQAHLACPSGFYLPVLLGLDQEVPNGPRVAVGHYDFVLVEVGA